MEPNNQYQINSLQDNEGESDKKDDEDHSDEDHEYYTIDNEYKIDINEKLGGGSFGHIYKCISIKNNQEYAAKIESNSTNSPQLMHEYKVLKSLEGGIGIPKCHLYTTQGMDTVVIMDLLGYNLEDIIQTTKAKKFSLKTSLMIIDQMITRLYFLHSNGYIHRDLKPENLVIGKSIKDNIIYLIDYGLSRKYIDQKTKAHIAFKENRPIIGTVRYISINTHKGFEQSRRDDLLSLCYILLYFIDGELPWDNTKTKTREEKYNKIMEIKMGKNNEELCKGKPQEILMFFNYIFDLQFNECPNYNYLKDLVKNALERNKWFNDAVYDWTFNELLECPVENIREMKRKKREERLMMEMKREEEEKIKKEKDKEKGKDKVKDKDNIKDKEKEKGNIKGKNGNLKTGKKFSYTKNYSYKKK